MDGDVGWGKLEKDIQKHKKYQMSVTYSKLLEIKTQTLKIQNLKFL